MLTQEEWEQWCDDLENKRRAKQLGVVETETQIEETPQPVTTGENDQKVI